MEKINIPQGERFVVQIYLKGISGSKSFLTEDNFQSVINVMKRHIEDYKSGDQVLLLKIIQKDSHRAKTIKFKVSIDNPKELLKDIKSKIEDFYICPTREKYRVVVNNLQTKKLDKRGFSMRFRGTISECKVAMQELLGNIIKENTDDDIIFESYHKSGNYTHTIIVQKSGTSMDYKKLNSKCFSIKFKNYSSEEIVNLIRRKLQNGKE